MLRPTTRESPKSSIHQYASKVPLTRSPWELKLAYFWCFGPQMSKYLNIAPDPLDLGEIQNELFFMNCLNNKGFLKTFWVYLLEYALFSKCHSYNLGPDFEVRSMGMTSPSLNASVVSCLIHTRFFFSMGEQLSYNSIHVETKTPKLARD